MIPSLPGRREWRTPSDNTNETSVASLEQRGRVKKIRAGGGRLDQLDPGGSHGTQGQRKGHVLRFEETAEGRRLAEVK